MRGEGGRSRCPPSAPRFRGCSGGGFQLWVEGLCAPVGSLGLLPAGVKKETDGDGGSAAGQPRRASFPSASFKRLRGCLEVDLNSQALGSPRRRGAQTGPTPSPRARLPPAQPRRRGRWAAGCSGVSSRAEAGAGDPRGRERGAGNPSIGRAAPSRERRAEAAPHWPGSRANPRKSPRGGGGQFVGTPRRIWRLRRTESPRHRPRRVPQSAQPPRRVSSERRALQPFPGARSERV